VTVHTPYRLQLKESQHFHTGEKAFWIHFSWYQQCSRSKLPFTDSQTLVIWHQQNLRRSICTLI